MRATTGLFTDRKSAERAYQVATTAGYSPDEIDVVMSEETRKRFYGKHATLETEVANKSAEGAAVGGAVGATAGAIAGVLAAAGTITVPGLGLVVAGPIATGLAGAGAGGVAAGLAGALVGWGIPEDRLKTYEKGIGEGGIVLGVKPHSDQDAQRFESEWRAANARDICS